MNDDALLGPEALEDLPIFPLPGAVLLPGTFVALHIFEPRYRRMLERCLEGHRLMAIAMLDEDAGPDDAGRPAIRRVAGVGVLRRSARLPDGRYNVVLEGLGRVDVADEHPPTQPFRRARARRIDDLAGAEPALTATLAASLRGLALRALAELDPGETEAVESLGDDMAAGRLADLVAAALVTDAGERQQVLEAQDVRARLDLVAGAVGAKLLEARREASEPPRAGWGVTPGEA